MRWYPGTARSGSPGRYSDRGCFNAVDKAVIRSKRRYLSGSACYAFSYGRRKVGRRRDEDKSVGITVGDGYDAFGLEVYTDQEWKILFYRKSEEPVPASGSVTIAADIHRTLQSECWTADHMQVLQLASLSARRIQEHLLTEKRQSLRHRPQTRHVQRRMEKQSIQQK